MSDRPKLFPDGDYTFQVRNGQTVVDGKVYYPAFLRLRMGKQEALRVMAEIATKLYNRFTDDERDVDLYFSGTIERGEEDD